MVLLIYFPTWVTRSIRSAIYHGGQADKHGSDLIRIRDDADAVSWKIEDGQIASFNFLPTPGPLFFCVCVYVQV